MTDTVPHDWLVDPLGGPLLLDREREADEWQARLTTAITQRAGAEGFSANWRGQAPRQVAFSVTGSTLRSTLLAIPHAAGFYLLVGGSGEPTDDQVLPWAEAAVEAQQSLGGEQPLHSWTAIVGHKPDLGSQPKTFGAEVVIGGMRLVPGGQRLEEGRPPRHPSLGQIDFHQSEPIVVFGESPGFRWEKASRDALSRLHRLCSLLTLVFDECWVVREVPAPIKWGVRSIPAQLGIPSDLPDRGPQRDAEIVAIPDWVNSAFERAERDRKFASRLAGYLEGTSAQFSHPSLAAVALVAVVESIGTKLRPPRRCDCCRQSVGATKAFKYALRQVVDEETATRLDALYGTRSKTAHEGQLFGSEPLFGWSAYMSFWEPEPERTFEFQQLWTLRSVAGQLIKKDVLGQLTPAQDDESR